jgi:quinol-cytochrome oxidoreductase complex cytochrome b subunit
VSLFLLWLLPSQKSYWSVKALLVFVVIIALLCFLTCFSTATSMASFGPNQTSAANPVAQTATRAWTNS